LKYLDGANIYANKLYPNSARKEDAISDHTGLQLTISRSEGAEKKREKPKGECP
jgi:hypothetical protein